MGGVGGGGDKASMADQESEKSLLSASLNLGIITDSQTASHLTMATIVDLCTQGEKGVNALY